LQTYKEGALVMLALLQIARDGAWLLIPEIVGHDPLEIVRSLKKLNEFIYTKAKIPNQAAGYFSAEANRWFTSGWELKCDTLSYYGHDMPERWKQLGTVEFSYKVLEMTFDNYSQCEDVKKLQSTLEDRWEEEVCQKRPEARDWWLKADKTAA
jgi:hypothetical protein